MTHPSLDTPALQLFSDEIDFFDPQSISKKVSLVDAMAQAQIAYLFCVSLCTFFHRDPDAVLLLLAPKHLEGPHSILNHEPHIAQIDTPYVQSMCQKWAEKEMFENLGFFTEETARKCVAQASGWQMPECLNQPGVERSLHLVGANSFPFPVCVCADYGNFLLNDSNEEISIAMGLFVPPMLRIWTHERTESDESSVVSLINQLSFSLLRFNGATNADNSALVLNRHSLPTVLSYFQHTYGALSFLKNSRDRTSFVDIPSRIEAVELTASHQTLAQQHTTSRMAL